MLKLAFFDENRYFCKIELTITFWVVKGLLEWGSGLLNKLKFCVMFTFLYYIYVLILCILLLVVSVVALVLTYPFDKPRRVVHELSRMAVRLFLGLAPCWRHDIKGLERVDKSKRYIIVMNHQSMVDIPVLYFVNLNFRWVSKREVFKIPFFGQFLRLHGDICINRGRAAEAHQQLLDEGRVWLNRGVSIAIFPEGTRSKSGEIQRFKVGAFDLAQQNQVEILPIVFDGTRELMKGLQFRWSNTIKVRVLEPISKEAVVATDPKLMAQQVQELMTEELAKLRA